MSLIEGDEEKSVDEGHVCK